MKRLLYFLLPAAVAAATIGCNRKQQPHPAKHFIVEYQQPVQGYRVKADLSLDTILECMRGELIFEKDGKRFTLSTTSFGDTVFNKGYLLPDSNVAIMHRYQGKTIGANYSDDNAPFIFKDVDFDGVPELLIVHKGMHVKFHDYYNVYRIVDNTPVLIDYPPYHDKVGSFLVSEWDLSDYVEFDDDKKTIISPYPEGDMKYSGCCIYGIGSTKDTVMVNGRTYLFNHIELVREERFD